MVFRWMLFLATETFLQRNSYLEAPRRAVSFLVNRDKGGGVALFF